MHAEAQLPTGGCSGTTIGTRLVAAEGIVSERLPPLWHPSFLRASVQRFVNPRCIRQRAPSKESEVDMPRARHDDRAGKAKLQVAVLRLRTVPD